MGDNFVNEDVDWENAETFSAPLEDIVQPQKHLLQQQHHNSQHDEQREKRMQKLVQMQEETERVRRQQAMHDRMRGSSSSQLVVEEEVIKVKQDKNYLSVSNFNNKESGESLQTVLVISNTSSKEEVVHLNDKSRSESLASLSIEEPLVVEERKVNVKTSNSAVHSLEEDEISLDGLEYSSGISMEQNLYQNRQNLQNEEALEKEVESEEAIHALKEELRESLAQMIEAARRSKRVTSGSASATTYSAFVAPAATASKAILRRSKVASRRENTFVDENYYYHEKENDADGLDEDELQREEDIVEMPRVVKKLTKSSKGEIKNEEVIVEMPRTVKKLTKASKGEISKELARADDRRNDAEEGFVLRESQLRPSLKCISTKRTKPKKSGFAAWLKRSFSFPSSSSSPKSSSSRKKNILKSAGGAATAAAAASASASVAAAPVARKSKSVSTRASITKGASNLTTRASVSIPGARGSKSVNQTEIDATTKKTVRTRRKLDDDKGAGDLNLRRRNGNYSPGVKGDASRDKTKSQRKDSLDSRRHRELGRPSSSESPAPTLPSIDSRTGKPEMTSKPELNFVDGSRTPSSTDEWVEAASSNLRLKAEMSKKVFETAERLAEVAEARTRELNSLEEAFKRVEKELECYKLFERKLRNEGILAEATIREVKLAVVEAMKSRVATSL